MPGNLESSTAALETTAPEDGSMIEDGADSGSDDTFGSSSLLRHQLEALAMGLVGLSHLTLKDARLGTSRKARLQQDSEFLEEVQSLRHWISNRAAPAGWDPARI